MTTAANASLASLVANYQPAPLLLNHANLSELVPRLGLDPATETIYKELLKNAGQWCSMFHNYILETHANPVQGSAEKLKETNKTLKADKEIAEKKTKILQDLFKGGDSTTLAALMKLAEVETPQALGDLLGVPHIMWIEKFQVAATPHDKATKPVEPVAPLRQPSFTAAETADTAMDDESMSMLPPDEAEAARPRGRAPAPGVKLASSPGGRRTRTTDRPSPPMMRIPTTTPFGGGGSGETGRGRRGGTRRGEEEGEGESPPPCRIKSRGPGR